MGKNNILNLEETFYISSGKKVKIDDSVAKKHRAMKTIRKNNKGKANLKSFSHRRKMTLSEKMNRQSVYENMITTLTSRTARRKDTTVEIVYMLHRIENKPNECQVVGIEEWNGQSATRSFGKRFWYRDRQTGEWRPGKQIGLRYEDIEMLLRPSEESEKIRKKVLSLLYGPMDFERDVDKIAE